MVGVLWVMLNPLGQKEIQKAAVFDLLLLLVFNVSKLTDQKIQQALANFMITFLEKHDIIPIKPVEQVLIGELFEKSENQNIELVNNFLTQVKKTWPLKKIVSAFKKAHLNRSSKFAHDAVRGSEASNPQCPIIED